MASIAPVCRHVVRRAGTASSPAIYRRTFTRSVNPGAAQNFLMPAMSPTMTEGNIASWKVKEGDSFAAGDVLLEIETDKAQMDVEAQEDGTLAKIMMQNGSKAVKVGSRIAVLAEQSDDLSALEMPPDEQPDSSASKTSTPPSSSSSPSASSSPQTSSESSKPTSSERQGSSSSKDNAADAPTPKASGKAHTYPLYPSVHQLLRVHGIDSSDIPKIPATGPKGRLLKGDVLAYVGQIEKGYSADQSTRIEKLGHLDLSNIKVASTTKAPSEKPKEEKAMPAAEPDIETEIAVQISLAAVLATQRRIKESLGLTLPLSTFIARASELANSSLPASEDGSVSAEELFDAVLGLDKVATRPRQHTSRGHYIPQVSTLGPAPPSRRPARPQPRDIIDELTAPSGKAKAPPMPRATPAAVGVVGAGAASVNIFSVSAKKGEERRARTYLERMKTTLESEPGRCVL